MRRPVTTLYMLVSVDGKISTGATDELDVDRDFPQIPGLKVDVAAGNDFPEDLSPYQLIIHCGACVASSRLVQARIKKALCAGVPITNYGIAIAWLQGILDRVSLP